MPKRGIGRAAAAALGAVCALSLAAYGVDIPQWDP